MKGLASGIDFVLGRRGGGGGLKLGLGYSSGRGWGCGFGNIFFCFGLVRACTESFVCLTFRDTGLSSMGTFFMGALFKKRKSEGDSTSWWS